MVSSLKWFIAILCLSAYAQAAPVSNLLPPGMVFAFAGNTCPSGSLTANGSSLLRSGLYAKLYAAIGTNNGSADGTHFNIPDYRGRFIRMVDSTASRDPDVLSRTAMNTGGATGDSVGSVQGFAFQAHEHSVQVGTGGGGTSYAAGLASASGSSFSTVSGTGTTSTETRPLNAYVNFCIKY